MSKHHSGDAGKVESGKGRNKASTLDKLIGQQLRKAREERRLSLVKTAARMTEDTSYQQVQKYEKGQNRIAASTLLEFSIIFQKPAEFFLKTARSHLERNEFKNNIRE